MPNWCENCLIFMHNGTTEGEIALRDFHDRIKASGNAYKNSENDYYWECDIENYSYDQSNGLFQYQDKLSVNKRGYIEYVSDINNGCFHMLTYDAWSANNAFWILLLNRLYGNMITFTYLAAEPGMGLYYTDNKRMLPRYNVDIYTNGLENLMSIPTAFNTDDNLFMYLNTQNPYVGYPTTSYDYSTKWNRPNKYDFDFHMIIEGNDDKVIAKCEDYVFGKEMPDITKVDDIKQHLPNVDVDIDEYKYVSLESEVPRAIKENATLAFLESNATQEEIKNITEKANKNLEKFGNELGVDYKEFNLFKEEL